MNVEFNGLMVQRTIPGQVQSRSFFERAKNEAVKLENLLYNNKTNFLKKIASFRKNSQKRVLFQRIK